VAYAALECRPFNDLDLLVLPADLDRVRDLMRDAGYGVETEVHPSRRAALIRVGCEEVWRHPRTGCVVEIHWRLFPRFYSFPLETERLRERAVSMPVGAGEVPVPGAVDLLLIHAAHGAWHGWERLEWVAATAGLLRPAAGVDHDELMREASRVGARRMVRLAMELARGLPGQAGSPPTLGRDAAAVRRLAAAARRRWFRRPLTPLRGFAMTRYHLASRERLTDRLAYLGRSITDPGLAELAAPARLGPLDPLLRPFRLIRRSRPGGPGAGDERGSTPGGKRGAAAR
jgi:hypothetical protein